MSATVTAAEVKTILNRAGDRTGFKFIRGNPFYANDARYQAMREKWLELKELNAEKISSRTAESIENYLADCYRKVMSY